MKLENVEIQPKFLNPPHKDDVKRTIEATKQMSVSLKLATLIAENTPAGNKKIEEIMSKYEFFNLLIDGNPLLIYAVEQENFEACKILLRNKVCMEELGHNGHAADGTAMHMAALTTDERFLDLIVAQGGNINAAGYVTQDTPLARAIHHFQFKNANKLIGYDADLEKADVMGQTPIYRAIEVGAPLMVHDLIQAGAKVDVADKTGMNPLHYNLKYGDFLPFKYESEYLVSGDEITKMLIFYGCYTDVSDKDGNRPLHYACAKQRRKSARILVVDNDVDVNVPNNVGLYPLHWAAYKKDIYLMNLLLSNKADPNIVDKNGNSPLHYVAQLNFIPGIRLLLKAGADKNLVNDSGTYPIDLTTDMMAANLLSIPKYGQDLTGLYEKASEYEKRKAFRHYMIAKQCCESNKRKQKQNEKN